jgi:pyroglutamyl-peptidase
MDETLNTDGPAAYFSTLPFRHLVETMRENDVPARISNSAGAYGCNQIFYHLMDYISRENLGIPGGFIHVASTPDQVLERRGSASMSLDLTAKGLAIVAEELARGLRDA